MAQRIYFCVGPKCLCDKIEFRRNIDENELKMYTRRIYNKNIDVLMCLCLQKYKYTLLYMF